DHAFLYGHRGRWRGPVYFSETLMFPAIQLNLMSELIYHVTCTGPRSDEVTDEENRHTLTVVSRDFTGLDCTAFAYDLHRPDERYEDRGAHPYGEGVDRYRSWEDLDEAERSFVARQRGLTLLDLLNPHLFGIDGFALGRRRGPDRWVAQLGHALTPFGYSVDARVGLRRGRLRGIFALRNGINAVGWFPTAAAQVIDLRLRRAPLGFDVEADAWLQPRGLRYHERAPAPGGRLALTGHWWVARGATIDATLDGKTAGYVPGSVFLDRNLSLRLGLTARL
ncbi:MAG: hypothetical protein KDK70_19440, partial [Myxococcales bacterium]|nr:hypothetical protein [Myxococcales bacterium]